MDKIKVLSLFSGIGAFEKALSGLDVDYEIVNYCEIDKFASKAYSTIHNISEEKNLGDILNVDIDKLPDYDLQTWGFPCQDISVAGKQEGIIKGKTRSGLYHEGFNILKAKRPKYSIMENVKALVGKRFIDDFNNILKDIEALGYTNYWKVLNAKDFGVPQNRERVFIISIRNDIDKMFEFPKNFDNGIRLVDLLENEVDEKYYLSDSACEKLITKDITNTGRVGYKNKGRPTEIAKTILASDYRGMCNQGLNVVKETIPCCTPNRLNKRQNGRRFKTDGEPMFSITCQDRHGILQRVGTIGKGSQGNRVYSGTGISTAILAGAGGGGAKTGYYTVKERIRRLTPLECFRLMGFDDLDYQMLKEVGISDTQMYKMAGNSIVVDVVAKILSNLIFSSEIITLQH